MPRIINRVRQLRLDYAQKVGRPVEQKEVAEAAGVHKNTLSRIEQGKITAIDFETLVKLCVFYTAALERPIGVGDVLEFDPNSSRALDLAAVSA